MLRYFISLLFLSFSILSFSQKKKDRYLVKDQESGIPLAYASIQWKNWKHGTIANSEGTFVINYPPYPDTLQISFIGYQTAFFPYSKTPFEKSNFSLKKKAFEIQEVKVTNQKDQTLNILYKAIVEHRKMTREPDVSSGYLLMQTLANNKPTEQIEALCNFHFSKNNGNSKTVFKTGKFEQTEDTENLFLSLNTTNLISGTYLFAENSESILPKWPGNFSKSKIAKKFSISTLKVQRDGEDWNRLIEFIPVDSNKYFGGQVLIRESDYKILKINFHETEVNDIISPIVPIHSISACKWRMYIAFQEQNPIPQWINLKYKFNYHETLNKVRRMNAEAFFAFAPSQRPFTEMRQIKAKLKSDYELIEATPTLNVLWEHAFHPVESKKQKMIHQYFEKEGYALDFDSTMKQHIQFNTLEKWTPQLIGWDFFKYSRYREKPSTLDNKTSFKNYQLLPELIVNYELIENTPSWNSAIFIDHINSFYFAEKDFDRLAFINLYLDLYELHRRRLESQFKQIQNSFSIKKAKELEKNARKLLQKDLDQFISETRDGKDPEKIESWDKIITKELGISSRIIDEDMIENLLPNSPENVSRYPGLHEYNTGTDYLINGQLKKAHTYLSTVYRFDSQNIKYAKNLAACLFLMGRKEKACAMWEKLALRKIESANYCLENYCN